MSRRYPQWKRVALQEAEEQIYEIEDAGHKVDRFTDHHWRINGIDVWPSSKKYRHKEKVKHYQSLWDVTKCL